MSAAGITLSPSCRVSVAYLACWYVVISDGLAVSLHTYSLGSGGAHTTVSKARGAVLGVCVTVVTQVLHLKRFVANVATQRYEKCTDRVSFPENLNVRRLCAERVRLPPGPLDGAARQGVGAGTPGVTAGAVPPRRDCPACTFRNEEVHEWRVEARVQWGRAAW